MCNQCSTQLEFESDRAALGGGGGGRMVQRRASERWWLLVVVVGEVGGPLDSGSVLLGPCVLR